jgi:DNA polymerase-3 subunit alpha
MDPDLAGRIFAHMAQFAGYGFNKAHSAGYAIISYQTAFLKANYPAEFMAALLSSEIGNSDKLPVLMAEAVEMGIEIRPPDVNESRARFLPSGRSIRFGLAGVKNVGEGAAQAIAAERAARGPYKDLVDFCSRLDTQSVNKKTIESLARCGAFDGFGLHRARVFGGIDFAIARAAEAARDRVSGQGSLFDLMAHDRPQAAADLPEQREWHENELLAAERELLGIYLTGHPLTQYASLLARYQLCDVKGLDALKDKAGVRLGGIVSGLRRTFTKSKESMAILQLEDLDGNAEVVVFPDAYQKYATRLEMDSAILVCGELSVKENARSIHAVEIYPLADAPRHFAVRLGIHIPATHLEDDRIARIKDMLRRYPGNTPVVVCLQYPDGAKVFVAAGEAFKVCPEEQLILELEREVGEKGVYVAVNPKPFLNPRPTRGARSAGEG